ncbi:MAG: hypothetical protein A3J59_01150 [Candidatus Buchananbacteria bacterium RIFCSPHIGHO2_02_FULL_56_16]|uniref:Type 4 fimbrial biogenesis protein PilO n=1 Tax=Candidatus Buchananbacteria bacterium RIFCSPHIGHO2_02_FULL_56_16 TaxID=1797542 RepID=A0A1G1YFU6_9BACT|nr:MAG: hypothetical protein A3J59_01150 [Candidatus Buchananbacteria bacterium RIFCSPHIGHO2_02_FULL_56_16]
MKLWQRLTILVLTILVGVAAVVFLIIVPTMRDIERISDDVYREIADLERKWERGQRLRETISNFEKIKAERSTLTRSFIVTGRELEFITTLEGLVADRRLTQNIQLQFEQAVSRTGYEEIPITITLEGRFNRIMQYLDDLERLPYYVTFTAFNFNTGSAASPGRITATFVGNVYRLPAPEGPSL